MGYWRRKTISAWDENWLGHDYCLDKLDVHIPENLKGAKVCELIDESGNWNMRILQDWLPEKWLDRLRSCVPPLTEDIPDGFYFVGTSSGTFSVKAMVHEVECLDSETEDMEWKLIWKAAIPERCKNFMWLLKHDKILTNLCKNKKGLGNAGCKLCGHVCETTMHGIHDCSKCLQVWKSIVPSDMMAEFFS